MLLYHIISYRILFRSNRQCDSVWFGLVWFKLTQLFFNNNYYYYLCLGLLVFPCFSLLRVVVVQIKIKLLSQCKPHNNRRKKNETNNDKKEKKKKKRLIPGLLVITYHYCCFFSTILILGAKVCMFVCVCTFLLLV